MVLTLTVTLTSDTLTLTHRLTQTMYIRSYHHIRATAAWSQRTLHSESFTHHFTLRLVHTLHLSSQLVQ